MMRATCGEEATRDERVSRSGITDCTCTGHDLASAKESVVCVGEGDDESEGVELVEC
jgi:hypothetical protein